MIDVARALCRSPLAAIRTIFLPCVLLLREWQARTGDAQALVVEDPKPKAMDPSGRPREPDRHQPRWIVEKYFEGE